MRVMPLALGWLTTRAWVLLSGFGIISYPNYEYLFSDVRLYDWWAGNIADGHFPINDPAWQYPPLAAVVFLAGYLVAGNMVGFVFHALLADLAVFVLLMQRGRAQNTLIPLSIWVMAPLAIGPIMLGRFDVYVTLAAVFALLSVGQARKFGIAVAVGALLKVWPLLLLLATPKSSAVKVLTWFVATFATGSILLSFWWHDSFSFIGGQRSRGLQIESVGALPYQIWNAGPGKVQSAYQFGAIEVVASGTHLVSLIITLVGIALLGILLYWRIFGKLASATPADIAFLAVLISIVTSRVLSPQYMIWVFGLLAVCAFNPQKNFRVITILIGISTFLGQLIYPWLYAQLQLGDVTVVALHSIRILALLAATGIAWKNIQEISQQNPSWKAAHLTS
jgi:hypothetical protein